MPPFRGLTNAWSATAAGALLLFLLPQQGRSQDTHEGTTRHRSLLELRNGKVVRQQWDVTCGAAAVATLLTYQLGDPTTERQAALGMLRAGDIRLVRARLGFSLLDLKRFAAMRGYAAQGFGNLTLSELLAMAPAIVPIRAHGLGHFVIVRGRRGDRLLLADPAFGNRTVTVDHFLRVWNGGIGFTVVRPGDPHPVNRMAAPAHLFLQPTATAMRATDVDLRQGI